jgi:hypothetical protein
VHLTKLLDHFDSYESLHIEVNSVRDQLIDLGVQDEIRFHFVDIKSEILRGLIYRYSKHRVPYGDPILCSEICIAKSLPNEWRRLVAVKELLHITDTPNEAADSEQEVDKLIERMSLPFEVMEETRVSTNDKLHLLPALSILVPKACREILREQFARNHITRADIANMAQIPERYVRIVIDDWFESFIDSLKASNGK